MVVLSGQRSGRKISIHSENNQIVDATTTPPTQYLNGDVKVLHARTYMYCDTAILRGNYMKMKYNVVLMQNDTIKIWADSMRYNGDSLVAYLYGNIILQNGPQRKLYTTYIRYDTKNKIAYYNRNARLEDRGSSLLSKSGRYLLNDKTAYFYDNVQVRGDGFYLATDSLAYNTDSQEVTFLDKTRIYQDTTDLYSERGHFNTGTEIGDFIGNAQYQSGSATAWADTIHYDGKLDHVRLSSIGRRSHYVSDQDTADANVIFYDRKNESIHLKGEADYKGKNNSVKGKDVYYDKKTDQFKTVGRATIVDGSTIIDAERSDYSKVDKKGEAHGNVIWRDTSAATVTYADHVYVDEARAYLLAYNDSIDRATLGIEVDSDTLWIKSDTLRSKRTIAERIIYPKKLSDREARKAKALKGISKDSGKAIIDSTQVAITPVDTTSTDTIYTGIIDTIDYLIGDNKVRMYKNDMQAVCDSLIFNRRDSVFTLMDDPYMWSDSSQIKGDTILITMKQKQVDSLQVIGNATVINTEDQQYFNQIEGRTMAGNFVDGSLNRLDIESNVRVVYYLLDEIKAYIGVNTRESSRMKIYFKDKKVSEIFCYPEPQSKVLPMENTDHEKLKIPNFIWNLEARPKSKEDL
jgi:lipopolysaccharide export system protein LptA